jgi:monovalent cation/hydrogen antiporter
MTAVSRFELILLLMALIVVLELVARRFQLPRAAALILGGIGVALIPGTPESGLIQIWCL